MKKEYKRPVAESVLLETAPVMSTTSAVQDGANVDNTPVGGNTPDLSAGNRSEWGNIW